MNLLITKIFKILAVIILFLLIAGAIISISLGGKIEQVITHKIQNQISSKIYLEEVNFDLYTKFPSAAVHIKNFLVFENQPILSWELGNIGSPEIWPPGNLGIVDLGQFRIPGILEGLTGRAWSGC